MASGDFKNKLNQWNRNFQRGLAEWSYGRNGADELASAILNLAVVLIIINFFVHQQILSLIALAFIGYSWFRISSKNVAARNRENEAAMQKAGTVLSFLANPFAAANEHKNYVHMACPHCGQKVRIPRGKGKVRVTCPKCHTRFEGKA